MISTHSDIRDETELLGGNVDGIFDGKLVLLRN